MKKFFYDAVYLIPLCMISVLWSAPYAITSLPKAVITLIPLAIALIGLGMLHLSVRGKLILTGSVLSVTLVAFLLSSRGFKESLLGENIWVLLFPLIAVSAFGFGLLITRFRVTRIILAAMLFAGLAYTLYTGYPPKKAVVGFVFFYIATVVTEEIQLRWKKSGETDHTAHLVYVAPFLCLFFLLFLIFPNSKKPYEWKFVRQFYHVAAKQIDIWKDQITKAQDDGMGDDFIGFSEFGKMVGDIKGNDQPVMELKVGTGAAVYLGGKSFDTFDGREWKKTYKSRENDNYMDTVETLTAITDGVSGQFPDYCKYTFIDVRLLNYKTKHVFMPCKTATVDQGKEGGSVKSKGGDYYFDTKKRYDDMYTLRFYRLYRDHPEFDDFAKANHIINEKKWEYSLNRFQFSEFENNTYEDYLNYKERMKEVYLPDTPVSERMDAFLDELLDGAEDDIEKLNRIEGYLSSLEYSRNPGDIPSNIHSAEEYLDYFIFEKKEGYCVHYATAFVLLARHEGIPARYMQGYHVKPKRKGKAQVKESDAHAWPECYIEGLGWIVYEPTPGHKTADYEEVLKEKENFVKPGEEIPEEADIEDVEEEEEEVKKTLNPLFVILPILAAFTVVALLLAIDFLINRIRYKSMKEDEKYRFLVRRNIRILGILGYSLTDGETLEEYRARLLKEKLPEETLSFIGEFEEYLYKESPDSESVIEIKSTDGRKIDSDRIVNLEKNAEKLSELVKEAGFRKRMQLFGLKWSVRM